MTARSVLPLVHGARRPLTVVAVLAGCLLAACQKRPLDDAGDAPIVTPTSPDEYAVLHPETALATGDELPVTFAWRPVRGAASYQVDVHRAEAFTTGGRVGEKARTTTTLAPTCSVGLRPDGYAWEVTALDHDKNVVAASPLRYLAICPSPAPRELPDLDFGVDKSDVFPGGIAGIAGHLRGGPCGYVVVTLNEGASEVLTPRGGGQWATQIVLTRSGPNALMVVGTDGTNVRQVALTLENP